MGGLWLRRAAATTAAALNDQQPSLSAAGFFSDLAHGYAEETTLASSTRSTAEDWEAGAVRYLDGGTVLATALSLSYDILDPAGRAIGPLRILTDGVWMWPSDLAYYLERYHCVLPADLVSHMGESDWTCPTDMEAADDELDT